MKLRAKSLTHSDFEPFGRLLEPMESEEPEVVEPGLFEFFVTFSNESDGWQIGFLKLTGDKVEKLENHPHTPEVFSPLSGKAILVVSNNPESREDIHAFYLDTPIVLNEGVWHNVANLSETSEMLIVENTEVGDQFFELSETLNFADDSYQGKG